MRGSPRKWVCSGKDGLEVRGAYAQPKDAICPAPDHFRTDMGPYLEIVKGRSQDGSQETVTVVLKPEYVNRLEPMGEDQVKKQKKHQALLKQISKAESVARFNELSPMRRAIKSLLGSRYNENHGPLMDKVRGLIKKKVEEK